MAAPRDAPGSALAPFASRAFLVIWLASVVGNLGTWMRDVASGWVMTSLSPSPVMVALVQAAASLPAMLLALPAGVLADLIDRRRLLLQVQVFLTCVSLVLAVFAGAGLLTPWLLLALVLAGGMAAALAAPAWQTSVPELVPRAHLRAAVALNSTGFNVSRAVGPALGGLVLTTLGVAATYAADALSYVAVIAALLWWRREVPQSTVPPESVPGALRAGLRYALHAPPLRRVLLRAAVFFAFGAAHWALLPLVARQVLEGGAGLYGLLLGGIGFGAVGGALLLPLLRARLGGGDAVLVAGSLASAAAQAGLALTPSAPFAIGICILAGIGWIMALTTLNATAQAVLPDWVRGRGLALYLTVFSGGMTVGSIGWGQLATVIGIAPALLVAASAGALAAIAMRVRPLPAGEASLDPSHHWPEPVLAMEPSRDGPVAVTVEYRVPPERHAAFRAAIAPLGQARRRDGAMAWGVFVDAEDPARIVEWFLLASWAEHQRQHARVTQADRDVQQALRAFHDGPPPRVTHLLALAPEARP
ncbi:MFS transporter [Neoroseomonas eburnea]|uniref:MFS transporter n=1 Tax=Neoroseomonas eburnea TaxID=1346889 RepID=UPI0030B9FC20